MEGVSCEQCKKEKNNQNGTQWIDFITLNNNSNITNHTRYNDEFIDDNTLTVNVARLRKKLEEAGMHDVIRTKKGIGYMLV